MDITETAPTTHRQELASVSFVILILKDRNLFRTKKSLGKPYRALLLLLARGAARRGGQLQCLEAG